MQNLVNTINTVGRSTGINISNIKVYSEDQQAKTYNGLFSNKFGFGITIYKSNGSIGAIAIVGSGTSQEQIKSFYSTISTVIRSLDSPLSEQDVESILEKLGSKDLSAKRYSTQAIGGTLTVSENNGMLMFQAIHN